MNRFVAVLSVAAAIAVGSQSASAQSCSVSVTTGAASCTVGTTLTTTMPSLMNLTLSGVSVVLAPPASAADFNASGLFSSTTTGPSFQVKSNRSYRVQIQADAATFTHTAATGAASYAKPITDVQWSTDAGLTALSTTATDIGTGAATALSAAKTVSYKTLFDITKDQPGAYSLGVTFTLIAP